MPNGHNGPSWKDRTWEEMRRALRLLVVHLAREPILHDETRARLLSDVVQGGYAVSFKRGDPKPESAELYGAWWRAQFPCFCGHEAEVHYFVVGEADFDGDCPGCTTCKGPMDAMVAYSTRVATKVHGLS